MSFFISDHKISILPVLMSSDTQKFQQAFEALNTAQEKAVETLHGPVLVVAGPGTGKTQVLALRIANILQKTDTDPRSILALTFTESGAIAMRKRLTDFIGSTAHSVHIATFHGFCQEIISEFPEKFFFAKNLEVLDELEKLQILKKILTSLNLKYLKPLYNPNFFLREIASTISHLKKEGIDPGVFKNLALQEQKEFENIPESEKINIKTGKMKGKYLKQEKNVQKSVELHKVYTEYQELLEREGQYDFDDMILFVLQLLQEDEDLLWTLRERYLFVLADELQDTNGAQMRLLKLFVGDEESPNIFAVGDDDQSIYRFQGASLENILSFRQKFLSAKIICLTKNYRSTQSILNLASAVIQNNTERLEIQIPEVTKNISAALRKEKELPQMHIFSHEEQEHNFVVQKIEELCTEEDISYSEIAILVRTNAEGFEILDLLKKRKVPAIFSGRGNALQSQITRQVLNLLKLVLNPENDTLFFECLHYPFFSLEMKDIWNLWREVRDEVKDSGKFWQYFSSATREVSNGFTIFFDHILKWQKSLKELSLLEWFQVMLTESGILDMVTAEKTSTSLSSEHIQNLNHLNALFMDLKNFCQKNKNASLAGFLQRIELREEFGLPLSERDVISSAESVQILTAHRAKGLEFEAVFLLHGQKGKWGDRRKISKIHVPEEILQFEHERDENEEERRLFYTACTRAKKFLFLSRSQFDGQNREKSESRFFSEIPPDAVEQVESVSEESNTAFEIIKNQMMSSPKSSVFPKEFIERSLQPENFLLSHSAFESYRENPQKFLWEYILRIPEVKHPAAVLGTALHRALEAFVQHLPKEDSDEAESIFFGALKRQVLSTEDRNRIEEEGKEILKNYLTEYTGSFMPALKTEMNFRSHQVMLDGGIPLTGKLDKIEWISEQNKTVKVIDYKATSPKSENQIRGIRESDANDITAGRYFRQLVFYSLLCDLSPRFEYRAEIFEIDFLIPNTSGAFKKLSFEITEQEKESLKEEIRLVWKRIQNLDFTPKNIWGDDAKEGVFEFLTE